MEYTIYTRKPGRKTWQKGFSFPKSLEECEQWKKCWQEMGLEVEIKKAGKGRSNNYNANK